MLKVEIAFEALGTWNVVTLYGQNSEKEKLKFVSNQIKRRVCNLDERFSIFKEDSEISKMNEEIIYHPCSEDMQHLLVTAEQFFQESGGKFNVAAANLTLLWKKALKAGIMPEKEEIQSAQRIMNEKKQLDLGAIVKGFALDEAARLARSNEIKVFMLNFGGAVYVAGKEQMIGIQNPREKTGNHFARIKVKDKAVVTAGVYEQQFRQGGVIYHHIIDPVTGYPSQSGLMSVTVIGMSAEEMDALSTAVLLCGIETGISLIKAHHAEGILITNEGEIYATENVKEMFYEANKE